MKERPILFSGPMIRAILAGTKTQTRLIVKIPAWVDRIDDEPHCSLEARGNSFALTEWNGDDAKTHEFPCPYGQPGDRLWVREAWAPTNSEHPRVRISYQADMTSYGLNGGRADELLFPEPIYDGSKVGVPKRWKPSIHMPRWASRITLEIVSVRVERLQSISEADAKAEGVVTCGVCYGKKILPSTATARERFTALWNSLNAARGHGWEQNEFVWVVEFRRINQKEAL